jgi:hypothetical protein
MTIVNARLGQKIPAIAGRASHHPRGIADERRRRFKAEVARQCVAEFTSRKNPAPRDPQASLRYFHVSRRHENTLGFCFNAFS